MSCIEGFRRRFTLSDQMSILDTSLNLRDLLRVRDDHHQDSTSSGRNSLAGLTLGAVLGCEDVNNGRSDESNHYQFQLQQPPIRTPSRTLLDIIKDEESGTSYRGLHLEDDNSSSNSKQQKSWKSFKDRLLLRKAGAGLISSSSNNGNRIVVSDDDCGGLIGEYSSPGIRRRSSFSVVSPTTTSIVSPAAVVSDDHVQNDLNQQGGNTVSSALASSSSEPVVIMRLAAALAAEREEQRQQLVSSSSSTDAQLQENTTVLQVAQEDDDQRGRASNQTQTQIQNQTQSLIQNQNQTQTPVPNQNQTQTPIQNQNQRGVIAGASNDNQPLRVSLMALLEETVDYNRLDLMDIEEDEGDELVVVDKVLLGDKEKGGSGMRNEECKCCVCMIRPKGAAFIPCGHTFCRLCSRKLWVNRGNCPLCNSFILEILDIF